MMRYWKTRLIIYVFCIAATTIISYNFSTSYRLEKVNKGKLLPRAGFSNVTNRIVNAVGYSVAAQIPPEQKTNPAPLLGWLEKVHWEPGAELDIYDFLINPVDKCNAGIDNITLLVLIKSAPGNTERRDAARQTFISGAAKYNVSTRLLFIVGDSEAQDERENIQEEAQRHRDILKVGFHDSYYNLTVKLVMGFKWTLQFCTNSEFLMSMDDDVMVDIVTLVNDLDALPPNDHSQFMMGTKGEGFMPHRNVKSPWYVPEDFYPGKAYPPFPFGHGYLMSHRVVEKLYLIHRETPAMIPFDDVYCGILLNKLGIKIVHRPRWFKDRHPQKREQDYLQIELSTRQMERAWKTIEGEFEK